ncbi:RGCVC family protein [Actinosynnema sp. NPDC050801]
MDRCTPDNAGQVETPCPVCPHPTYAHDPIARRFCSATEAGALTRGCQCSSESSGATYGTSGRGNTKDRAGRA